MSPIASKLTQRLAGLQEKIPEQQVGLIPADAFFTRKVELPEGISREERLAFIQLNLEGNSPFPMEQLAWGCLEDPKSSHAFVYATPKARLRKLGIEAPESYFQLFPGFVSLFGTTPDRATIRFLSQNGVLSALYMEAGNPVPSRIQSRHIPGELLTDEAHLEARDAFLKSLPREDYRVEDGLWLGSGLEIDNDGSIEFRHRHLARGKSEGLLDNTLRLDDQGLWLADLRDEQYAGRERKVRQRSSLIWTSLRAGLWFALLLLGVTVWRQWNFGPMATWQEAAERKPLEGPAAGSGPVGLWRAGLPVAVLILIIFAGIYADGTLRMGESWWPLGLEKLALCFAEANVPAILIIASGVASLLAWAFFPPGAAGEGETPGSVFMDGMLQLFQPVLILVMAWMLSSTLNALEAADYLGELLGGRLGPAWFPLAVFLTGSLVAFTTGTSWGTMGLLMPLAIPLAFSLVGDDPAAAMELMPMVIGAVFSGAVFGDHCSPISDTTIVSPIACGVDPIDHVRTQLPYALLAAAGAALVGFLPAGLLGGSAYYSIAAAVVFLLILQFLEVISRPRKRKA